MKKIIIGVAILGSLLIFPLKADADTNPSCPSVYGAKCPTGNLFIDKKVKNPLTSEFIETLNSSGPNFLPEQEVFFRIEVRNIGDADMTNILVEDKLPNFVNFLSGPGNYDKNSNSLKWNIDQLRTGESKLFDLKVKIQSVSAFKNMEITCLTNFSQAQVNKQIAQDSSVFCVQNKVLPITTELPKTGPEDTLILIIAILGFVLATISFYKPLFHPLKNITNSTND